MLGCCLPMYLVITRIVIFLAGGLYVELLAVAGGESPQKNLVSVSFSFWVFQNWSGSSMKRRQDAFLLKALRFN